MRHEKDDDYYKEDRQSSRSGYSAKKTRDRGKEVEDRRSDPKKRPRKKRALASLTKNLKKVTQKAKKIGRKIITKTRRRKRQRT